jgi:hypothetical protein
MFWDTIRYTERHKDLSEMVREDLGDMEGYCDTTVRSKDIKGTWRGTGTWQIF